jgi:hypothetical protein
MSIFACIDIDGFNTFAIFEVLLVRPFSYALYLMPNSLPKLISFLSFHSGSDYIPNFKLKILFLGEFFHIFIEIHLFSDHPSDHVKHLIVSFISQGL